MVPVLWTIVLSTNIIGSGGYIWVKTWDLKSTVLKNPQIRSTFRNKSVEYTSVSIIDTSCLVLSRKYVHDDLSFVLVLGDIISVQYL